MNTLPILTTSDEITANLQAYAFDSDQAFSENTIKAIRADSKRFADWCGARGVPSLPADPDTLREYVDWGAEEFKPATVKRHLASVAHLHRAACLQDPTKDNKVRLAVKRMNRTKGTRQKQARGLTMTDAAIIKVSVEGTIRDVRDVAMILVARDIMARSSELVSLNREDVHFDEDGSGTVLIRKSKTDQEGMGAQRWISPDTVKALKRWFGSSVIERGAIFQSVTKSGEVKRGTRLSTTDVYRSIRRLGDLIGIGVSGHSCRVGMAQDLTANGAELAAIMQAGRWKSPTMPARYSERLAAGRGAVADLYKKKGVGFREENEAGEALPPERGWRP